MPITSPLVWIVDFDGTLINLDLGARFTEWVFKSRQVRKIAYVIRVIGAPINFLLKKLNRRQLIRAWSCGLTISEIRTLIDGFLVYIAPEIVINNTLLQHLRMDSVSKKVLLTGCSQELVTSFLIQYGVKDFDDVIGMTVSLGAIITRHPYGRSKIKFSRTYGPYIAVGDSWEDRFILQAAKRAIIIPRNESLKKLANQSGWDLLNFS